MERSELDFALTEEQEMLRQTVRDFAEQRVRPAHEHVDHAAVHPTDLVDGLKELGLFGVLAPADQGGAGMGFLAHVVCVEALAEAGGVMGGIVAAHGAVVDAVAQDGRHGDVAAALASGELLGAPALQEEDHGAVSCTATSGATPLLTGRKILVPFPSRAGAFLVLAKDAAGSAGLYLVKADARGIRHESRQATLGLLGLETAVLEMDGAPAAKLGLAGKSDDAATGARALFAALSGLRVAVAAMLTGVARGAVVHALRYAGERKQFDKPLLDFVAMRERLARADWRVAAARGLVHGAARLRDRGEPCALAAARARAFAAEAAMSAVDDALQVYGGYGYSREYPVERFYRDARFIGFGEGQPSVLAHEVVQGMLG